MCCFRLHLYDFNVLFFQKNKNLLQFTFEKNNFLCKKRVKNNLLRGKIPSPLGSNLVWKVAMFQNFVSKESPCYGV